MSSVLKFIRPVTALLAAQLALAAAPMAARVADVKPKSMWLAFVDGASRAVDGEWTDDGHATVLRLANESVYRDLLYANAWHGINARISPAATGLKYSFEVTAGANPRSIHLRYSGIDGIEMNDAGELEVAAGRTTIVHLRPAAHQNVHGRSVPVSVRFVQFGSDVAFSVGSYDRTQPLVIESVTKS